MPTVDDLIISLTIDPTSDLGKLKDMLDDLKGPTGELQIPTAGGPLFKALEEDIDFIKRNIVFLIPTNIPSPRDIEGMKASASRQIKVLKADFEGYARKLVPIGKSEIETMLKEYGATTEEELENMLKERIEGWSIVLQSIAEGVWTDEKASKFMGMVQRLISEKEIPKGERKVLIEDIETAISEFQREIVEILKHEGVRAIREVFLATISPEKFNAVFSSLDEGLRESASDILNALEIQDEKLRKEFTNWLGLYGSTTKGTLEIMEQLGTQFGYSLEQLYKITSKEVEKDPRLKALAVLMFKKMGMTKVTQKGIPLGFQQTIINFVKNLRSNIKADLSKLSEEDRKRREEASKKVYEQLNKVLTVSKIFEKGRIDILLLKGWKENLDKIQALFGKEFAEGIKDMKGSIGVELKQILSESNRDQFRSYQTLFGNNLTAVASLVRESFSSLFPHIITSQINIWKLLQERKLRQPLTDVELNKIIENNLKDIPDKQLYNTIKEAITRYQETTKANVIRQKAEAESKGEAEERSLSQKIVNKYLEIIHTKRTIDKEDLAKEMRESEEFKELWEGRSNEEIYRAMIKAFSQTMLDLSSITELIKQLSIDYARGKSSIGEPRKENTP